MASRVDVFPVLRNVIISCKLNWCYLLEWDRRTKKKKKKQMYFKNFIQSKIKTDKLSSEPSDTIECSCSFLLLVIIEQPGIHVKLFVEKLIRFFQFICHSNQQVDWAHRHLRNYHNNPYHTEHLTTIQKAEKKEKKIGPFVFVKPNNFFSFCSRASLAIIPSILMNKSIFIIYSIIQTH